MTRILAFILAFIPAATYAVPSAIPFAGRLGHDDGTPFDGTASFTVALYDAFEAGNQVWGPVEYPDTPVRGGLFTLVLGEGGSPLDPSILSEGGTWLDVKVNGTPMVPRQRLLSAPYALRAGDAETLGGSPPADYALAKSLSKVCTTGAFPDLSGIPADLADGDADTLAALGCADGQIAKHEGGAWTCVQAGTSTDTLASLACVAGELAKFNGAGWECSADLTVTRTEVEGWFAPVAKTGAYADLTGLPDLSGYAVAASLAKVCTSGTFSDLTGIPADLADGDADTLAALGCADGQIAKHEGGAWTCVQAGTSTDTLASLACVAGELAKYNGSGWECSTDLTVTRQDVESWIDAKGYATDASLAKVAKTGAYADLTGKPDLSGYALTQELKPVCYSGSYTDLYDKPDLPADVKAELASLKGEVWCLKNCDVGRLGDCKGRNCDGTGQKCVVSGTLPDGTSCNDGAGRCKGGVCCTPATCYLLGASCGTADDGCGGVLSCGVCQDPKAKCFNNGCCVPKTCTDLGKQCGTWDDGCGGKTSECGPCGAGYTCDGTGQCKLVGLSCGGITCPQVTGYTVTCNAQSHCEYANPDTSGWKAYDVWVHVPAGSFTMGSPSSEGGHNEDEDPNHTVTFAKGFLVGKYEVTVGVYEACKTASPVTCTSPSTADWDGIGWGVNSSSNSRTTHPQNGLTWDQAGAVCTWLNGRLPSEAEWEYAATGPVHRKYPWGNSPEPTCSNNTAVFDEQGDGSRPWGCNSCTSWGCSGTSPVGSKTAGGSWSGALDMSGNVWEWCGDWRHATYNGAPTDGSAWVNPTGFARVLRGGAFTADPVKLRSSHRAYDTAGDRRANGGARCLRPLP